MRVLDRHQILGPGRSRRIRSRKGKSYFLWIVEALHHGSSPASARALWWVTVCQAATHDCDRAGCMLCALLTDGTEQETAEPSCTA